MQICPSCGEENPARFRLCGFCGTPLVAAAPAQEIRKTVSVVFSDLKGSTDLGERLDSEALREVMTRYFDAMRAEIQAHGGTIEKYIGDAIMAVFGLPTVHEDDALRAVRAAVGMQASTRTAERRAGPVVRCPPQQPDRREHGRGRDGRLRQWPAPGHGRCGQHRGPTGTGRARRTGCSSGS